MGTGIGSLILLNVEKCRKFLKTGLSTVLLTFLSNTTAEIEKFLAFQHFPLDLTGRNGNLNVCLHGFEEIEAKSSLWNIRIHAKSLEGECGL